MHNMYKQNLYRLLNIYYIVRNKTDSMSSKIIVTFYFSLALTKAGCYKILPLHTYVYLFVTFPYLDNSNIEQK